MIPESPFCKPMFRSLVLWMIILFVLVVIPIVVINLALGLSDNTSLVIIFLVGSLLPAAWVIWIMHSQNISERTFFKKREENKDAWKYLYLVVPGIMLSLGFTWLFFYLLSLIDTGFASAYFAAVYEDDLLEENPHMMHYLGMAFCIVIIAPVIEEVVFRGFLLHRFAEKWSVSTSILVSSLIFGLLHPGSVAGAFLFGVLVSLVYIKTQSLYYPIAIHMANNMIAVSLMALFPELSLFGSLEQFYTQAWVGILFLVISVPWLFWFLKKHWLDQELQMPEVVLNEAPVLEVQENLSP